MERKQLLKQRPVTTGKATSSNASDMTNSDLYATEGISSTSSSLKKNQTITRGIGGGRGGARAGAGRKAGTFNIRTTAMLDQLLANNLTPLQYMLKEMQDVSATRVYRLDAAKAAAPYLHPKLSSTEISTPPGKAIAVSVSQIPVDPQDAAEFYKNFVNGTLPA